MRPLRDFIIFQREKPPEKSEGGVFIPETAEPDAINEATVVSVGPRVTPDVRAGMRVRLSAYSGVEFVHDRVPYLYAREQDVVLILL